MAEETAGQGQPLAPKNSQGIYEIPVDIVGGNRYGRYPKINVSQTYNMMISDGWLVDYAGFQFISQVSDNPRSTGRGAHVSTVFNRMYVVVGNVIVSYDHNLTPMFIGSLATTSGEVYIAENNAGQVAFSDGVNIYIYNQKTFTFGTATIDFIPGFLSFQNTYFHMRFCRNIHNGDYQIQIMVLLGQIAQVLSVNYKPNPIPCKLWFLCQDEEIWHLYLAHLSLNNGRSQEGHCFLIPDKTPLTLTTVA